MQKKHETAELKPQSLKPGQEIQRPGECVVFNDPPDTVYECPKSFQPRHIRQQYFPQSIHQWNVHLLL